MGGEVYLAEYGRAKTIHFDLVEIDGVDLRVDAADGGSDCIVMTNEAAEGTATNDFVDEGTGYSLLLTAAEMTGARITVYVVDTATKVWLDKTIQIETFGHPSSAHPFLSPFWANGAVNDGSASATVWTFDGFTEATADHVIGSELTFTSGANAGQCRTVTDYTSTVITVSPAFLAAPADNDEFVLKARPTTSAGNVPGVDIAAILVDTAVIGAAGAGLSDLGGMSTGMKAEVNAEVDTAFLSNLIIRGNTAQAGSNGTITLDASASATNDTYRFQIVAIISGTGAGQSRPIISYVGSTKVASIEPNWATNPSSDSVFALIADGRSAIVADGITSTQLADTARDKISDGVWDEVLTGATHNVTNSSGRRLRQIQEAGGYSGGAIYIDTANGTTGTTDFENGVETKPCKNIADANTLASSLSLSKFVVSPGSSITFAASQENQEFVGENWDLALGGQSVSNSHITGADISGTGTSSTEVHFEHCEIGAVTLGLFHMDECDIEGTVTLSATGTSFILGCYHGGTAVIDFGDSLASSTIHIHDYHGALTISEFGSTATDILHFSSPDAKLTMDSTCIGGTLNLNGTFDFVNNGSNITVNQDGRVSRAAVARVINPQQNIAFSNITFEMYDSTNHNPNTGLTVTGERSLDGAAYAGVSGSIAEISDGTYQFDAAAGDMNGALVVFRFSSSGADDTFVHVKTAA